MWYTKIDYSNEIGVLTFDSNFEGIEYFKLQYPNTGKYTVHTVVEMKLFPICVQLGHAL